LGGSRNGRPSIAAWGRKGGGRAEARTDEKFSAEQEKTKFESEGRKSGAPGKTDVVSENLRGNVRRILGVEGTGDRGDAANRLED